MRSMDSILSDEPSLATMPDTAESDSQQSTSTSADKAETKPAPSEKPVKAETKPAPEEPAKHDEHDEDEAEPADVAGYRKALAAARGDKRKARKQWQEAHSKLEAHEREVAALRAQLAQTQTQQQQKPQPQPVDLTEEGFYGKGHEAVKAYVNAQVETIRRDFEARQQAQENARRQKSFTQARGRHEDFGEAFNAVMEAVRSNPSLEATILAEDDPGEAAYAYGKTYMRARNFSSIDELEKSIEARIRAEYEQGHQQSQPTAKPVIPKSIAGARGTGAGVVPTWNGPRSMNEILRR